MRRLLWLVPFMWPVAIVKSVKAGQREQADRMMRAAGHEPAPHHTPLGRLARWTWRKARA